MADARFDEAVKLSQRIDRLDGEIDQIGYDVDEAAGDPDKCDALYVRREVKRRARQLLQGQYDRIVGILGEEEAALPKPVIARES